MSIVNSTIAKIMFFYVLLFTLRGYGILYLTMDAQRQIYLYSLGPKCTLIKYIGHNIAQPARRLLARSSRNIWKKKRQTRNKERERCLVPSRQKLKLMLECNTIPRWRKCWDSMTIHLHCRCYTYYWNNECVERSSSTYITLTFHKTTDYENDLCYMFARRIKVLCYLNRKL